MISHVEQIKQIALQFLTDEKIKFTALGHPSFHAKDSVEGKQPNDYWVVPYTYLVFQEEDAFVYITDANQQIIYILTNHGYIYPGQEKGVENDEEDDWDDL